MIDNQKNYIPCIYILYKCAAASVYIQFKIQNYINKKHHSKLSAHKLISLIYGVYTQSTFFSMQQ